MIPAPNTNHLPQPSKNPKTSKNPKNPRCLASEIFNTNSSSKKKGPSKLQQYKNYNAFISHDPDQLSTTTDRIETNRTIKNRMLKNSETQREQQEKKVLLQIEETLEREYKFYQVKSKVKEQVQEKVPEMLLREASDDTVKKLCKVYPAIANVLSRVRD